jgi:DNA topoisomerase-6 subunit B
MDLKTLKKAIGNYALQKTTIQGILCNSFQKLSSDKAREIIRNAGIEVKQADKYSEHELIKIVNICRQTKFQSPNVDHLSPIGERIFTVGMNTERAIFTRKDSIISDDHSQPRISTKEMKPTLTGYSSRACIINNRPTIVECGLAYGGNLSYFKLYRFANKIPLLYDEGSDVAREVISEVELTRWVYQKQVKAIQRSRFSVRSCDNLSYSHFFIYALQNSIQDCRKGKYRIRR